jgi:hypothetical protein
MEEQLRRPRPVGWSAAAGVVVTVMIIGALIIAMSWVLSRLNRLYVRITGSDHLPHRYLPAWKKSLSDERVSPQGMSVLEVVILTSVLLAAVAMAIWFFIAAGSPLPSQ